VRLQGSDPKQWKQQRAALLRQHNLSRLIADHLTTSELRTLKAHLRKVDTRNPLTSRVNSTAAATGTAFIRRLLETTGIRRKTTRVYAGAEEPTDTLEVTKTIGPTTHSDDVTGVATASQPRALPETEADVTLLGGGPAEIPLRRSASSKDSAMARPES
jgi:hypothetical protein